MGRGRQKAMAKKMARDIKYTTYDPDYAALAEELSVNEPVSSNSPIGGSLNESDELNDYLAWAKSTAENSRAK